MRAGFMHRRAVSALCIYSQHEPPHKPPHPRRGQSKILAPSGGAGAVRFLMLKVYYASSGAGAGAVKLLVRGLSKQFRGSL